MQKHLVVTDSFYFYITDASKEVITSYGDETGDHDMVATSWEDDEKNARYWAIAKYFARGHLTSVNDLDNEISLWDEKKYDLCQIICFIIHNILNSCDADKKAYAVLLDDGSITSEEFMGLSQLADTACILQLYLIDENIKKYLANKKDIADIQKRIKAGIKAHR